MVMLDGAGILGRFLRQWSCFKGGSARSTNGLRLMKAKVTAHLTYWRTAHQSYFERQGAFSPDMLLYCERFRLIERIES
jgi:hypothetical protein